MGFQPRLVEGSVYSLSSMYVHMYKDVGGRGLSMGLCAQERTTDAETVSVGHCCWRAQLVLLLVLVLVLVRSDRRHCEPCK